MEAHCHHQYHRQQCFLISLSLSVPLGQSSHHSSPSFPTTTVAIKLVRWFGKVHMWWVRQSSQVFQVVGSARLIGGGLDFGLYVMCGMGFQQIWRPTFSSSSHFFISLSLYWDWIWRGSEADLGFVFFILDFWKIWKTHLLYELRRDILGLWDLWNDYFLCVEKGSSGFVKRSFSGLWMRICWVCQKGIF